MQFFKHLFKALLAYDPSVRMEITYVDETYDPIGAALFVTDAKNNPKYCSIETTVEKEIPEQKQNPDDDPDFGEKLFFIQDDLLMKCYDKISEGIQP